MKETIVWHKYPEEKPKVDAKCKIRIDISGVLFEDEAIYTCDSQMCWMDEERKNFFIRVVAWAEMSKGIKDTMEEAE